MSQRSRREHKPTSKFLSYKTQELSPLQNESAKIKKTPPAPAKNISSPSLTKKSAAIHGRRKLTTDEVEILCELGVNSSPEVSAKSPGIRRSGRQHKPNSKLKEYIHSSHIGDSVMSTSSASKAASVQSISKKGLSIEAQRSSKKVQLGASDPNENGSEISLGRAKHLSVGIVDCFEGLTKDLAKHYPTTPISNENEEKLGESESRFKSELNGSRRGLKRSLAKELDDCSDSVAKRGHEDSDEPLTKRGRLTPSAVRNLTKTKKSTRVTTVVETVDFANNQRQKTITRNKKSKVTKQYPCRNPTSSSKDSENFSSLKTSCVPKPSPHASLTATLSSQSGPKKLVSQNQPKDIRETLKKFLIMGTKVANAISETLKHNEEALLSKSSAFEKKCLSLVHALAKQGADLEEEDMEKVLKLLDEEQEERRVYRHTFLESLRVSHLTNMALYSQMLRLLKTL